MAKLVYAAAPKAAAFQGNVGSSPTPGTTPFCGSVPFAGKVSFLAAPSGIGDGGVKGL